MPASEQPTTPALPDSRLAGLPRGVRGYRTAAVAALVADLDAQLADLATTLATTEAALAERTEELDRARSQLRFWDDRSSFVEGEMTRARDAATEIEDSARSRAREVVEAAQLEAVGLVDRVCAEANELIVTARAEAREMFLRFEGQVDSSRSRLGTLERAQRRIIDDMRATVAAFERGAEQAAEIAATAIVPEALLEPAASTSGDSDVSRAADDRALASADSVDAIDAPTPPALTFGRTRALKAAEAFESRSGRTASATAIDVPLLLPKVLAAAVTNRSASTTEPPFTAPRP